MNNSPYKILLLLIFFLVVNSCVTSQTLLKERIEKFYSDLNKPRIFWELSSEDLKKDMTEQEYIKYFEENNYFKEYKNIRFSIEKINIKGNKARVKMRFLGEVINSDEKLDDILYDYWIFENDNWYMNNPSRTE